MLDFIIAAGSVTTIVFVIFMLNKMRENNIATSYRIFNNGYCRECMEEDNVKVELEPDATASFIQEHTGYAVFECPRCKRYFTVEYVPDDYIERRKRIELERAREKIRSNKEEYDKGGEDD
jgi:uncharacterized C2H2 Zn-finger protein